MTTITNGTDVISPDLVLGYKSSRTARTVIHDILDRSDPDVSLRAAASRSGTLELLFADETAATNAETLHTGISVWSILDPDRASVAMSYVVADGDIERELDDETRNAWVVRVPYREVTP